MLLRTHALNLSLVIVAAAALPAHASDPPSSVRWGAIASGCTVDTSAALANVDAAHGTVTFAAGKSGHIRLTCPIPATFVPSVFPFANDLTLTFYNDRGFVGGINHCSIQADLLRTNLNDVESGSDVLTISTAGAATVGRSILSRLVPEAFDFDTSYYWVDIDLFRDSGSASCNPAVVGTYLSTFTLP
jgi:hypothetical protein